MAQVAQAFAAKAPYTAEPHFHPLPEPIASKTIYGPRH